MERSYVTHRPVIDTEFFELPAERIPVNPEQPSGARLIPLSAVHRRLDKSLLEFFHGFLKQNAAIDHLRHQGLDLILQRRFLPGDPFRIARDQFSWLPVSRR